MDSRTEEKEVNMPTCTHANARYVNGELRCTCGAAWGGVGIDRLYRHFKKSGIIGKDGRTEPNSPS